jgi:hypothetical protein
MFSQFMFRGAKINSKAAVSGGERCHGVMMEKQCSYYKTRTAHWCKNVKKWCFWQHYNYCSGMPGSRIPVDGTQK